MYISTEITSIFPVPILYTPIQKSMIYIVIIPCFILKNNLVIIIMHIYIIMINVIVIFLLFKNSNELFRNDRDLILPRAIVYVVGVV